MRELFDLCHQIEYLSCDMTKPTKWYVHPVKTQISLGISPVWSGSLLSAWRKLGFLATHCAPSENSDQPGHCTAKTLIRLGGCPGWSESSLGAHSFCWFCRVQAHFDSSDWNCVNINAKLLRFQFFIDPFKLLPLQRFLEKPKRGGPGGRGGGRGGRGGGGK